jgi:BMFP domain-containing protein YqiC
MMAAFISRGTVSMGDTVENATFEILTGIEASLADLGAEMVTRFDRLEARIDRLDLGMREDRRIAAGMLMMMRATAGDFDARISEVEERVAAPESRTG